MREIKKDIDCTQIVTITKTAVKEELDKIDETKSEKCVRVKVVYKDANDVTLKAENYTIINDKYDLLMSAYPTFAPEKPANEYRENDLWYIIDLLRNGQ